MEPSWLIFVVVILALIFDFTNGWNDSANAIATVVSTRVLNPYQAVLLAAGLNIAGAFFSTAVAKTIGKGIVSPDLVNQTVVAAALVGGIVWNTVTTLMGLPISASHALIGGVMGAGIAHGGFGVLNLKVLKIIFEAMILSPLFGFIFGFVFMVPVIRLFFRTSRGTANRIFKKLQLLSASVMAFSHGTSDAQKVMGVITLALFSGGYLNSIEVPKWVILICALAMGLGTAVGGWNVIRTLGARMIKIEPVHGFVAETSASLILLFTAHVGVPVSTTHTITGCILGVGSTRRLSAVRWGVTTKILYAWIFTLPGTALMSYLAYKVFASFF
ncbi:MAG: anion permease [Deltaproteobacteria bacterium]|nr:MAG: anion permease [Deltaproteobacteria bacterium]